MMKRLRRALVQVTFLLCLLSLPAAFDTSIIAQQTQNPADQIAIPRPDADSLVFAVTVLDKKGNTIDGLDKNAFTIYENKVPQEITFFDSRDEPASIGIIFDLSGSLAGSKGLRSAWNAALRFVERSHSDNDYFVIAFASQTRVLVDWTRGSKNAAEQLSKYELTAKNKSSTSSNTALYDACYLGVEKMRSSTRTKQAILLITDGSDNDSHYTFTEVRESLKESGVMLYSLGIFSNVDSGSSMGMEGQAALDELSAISGGKAFFPSTIQEIHLLFDRIDLELRHQYLLGFKPAKDKADGKWHKIRIKVTPPPGAKGHTPDVFVRNREGYYAAKNLR